MERAGGGGGKLLSHGGECSHGGAEGKAERYQPERLVCSPAGAGGGWELRLRLRSDPRERTGVGGVDTA